MLKYARLLIDIPLDYEFPEYVEFANEKEILNRQQVQYEWKPLQCSHCHMYGHLEDQCRRKQPVRQEWRLVNPAAEQALNKTQTTIVDKDGFIQVDRRSTARHFPPTTVPEGPSHSNSFLSLLNEEQEQEGNDLLEEGLAPNG